MKTTINLLDPSQRHALDGVLANKEDVAVIYGPPGTGKSHLILSLLFELAVRGDKVLFVSQNTEALDVIIRKYKELNEELSVNDYSLSFLDFCWCLNDPAQKRVTYIRQQKNRIMTRPINTLPYAEHEEDNDIPYALTYRRLDKNENLNEQPDKIGFDELLGSSLRNIRHGDLIKDILHTVDDQSYRDALRLLNEYSDKNNFFADLNNPKNALKYLTPEKIDYTLHDAKIIAEDIYEAIGETIGVHDMIANGDMNVNDYLNFIYQISEYSKVIKLDYFNESGVSIKDLAKIAKSRLSVEDSIEETTEVSITPSLRDSVLQQKEDKKILELDNLVEIKDYNQVLTKIRQNINTLISIYKIDKETKLKNIFNCVFAEIDFGVFLTNDYAGFCELGYNELDKVIETTKRYISKNALSRIAYKIPVDVEVLDKKNIGVFVESVHFLEFLSLVLKDTGRTVQDIIDSKKVKASSISTPIDIRNYINRVDKYAKLCGTVLYLLNAKLDNINDYTLEELDSLAARQISDINIIFDTLSKNKKIEFGSIADVVSTINKNVNNKNTSRERERLDNKLEPFLAGGHADIEDSCKAIIDLSKEQVDLRKLLDSISGAKVSNEIKIEYIDKIKNCIIEAEQKDFFSPEFFTIHSGENLTVWKKHIYTLVDYNRLDEFDTYISQNRFIKSLKEVLTSKNVKVIDSYINDESITFDEFREHLTMDIVGTIYSNAPASVRKHIDSKYFADFRDNHKKLRVREYLSGLQKLKLKYEDPAKILSYYSNWVPASTNIEKIRKNSEMITNAFPVTIATPADVSKYMTAKKASYDYVIFDEASQLLPGQALPSIYRAKKAVIVGDPHQMPPTLTVSFGFNNVSDIEDEDDDTSNEQSILDLAINLQLDATYHLMTHYRSASNKLFEPSLRAIYEKEGVQPIFEAKSNEMPLYIEDNLGDDDNKNFASVARRVEFYLNKNKNATFCILFSRSDKQGMYGFKKYLEQSNDTIISQLYEKERVLISTITNCQGIQGDHTILYLPSYNLPRAMWFFKATAGAYKRLNVSITRQIHTLDIIMGDPKSKWINVCQGFLNDNNCNPNQRKSAELLNTLLVNAGQEIDEEYLEKSLGPNAQNIDSPLTQQLYDRLNEYYNERLGKDLKIWCEVGWNMVIPDAESIERNNRNVGFRIDIGIYSIKHKRFILGIEMDGATYHSGFNKEFSDLQRQEVLEKKGWNIYRIWSTNWLKDTEKEFQGLVKIIDEYLIDEYDDKDEPDDTDRGDGEENLFDRENESQNNDFNNASKIVAKDWLLNNPKNDVAYRPSDLFRANKYEDELVLAMEDCMNNGKPIEMKYSNTQLSDSQKAITPYQTIYIKDIDKKSRFFLGSFSLLSSPYRIKIADVFAYKKSPVEKSKKDEESNDASNPLETSAPEGEEIVNEELLSFYLGKNIGEQISFRYQASKPGSDKKWRNLELVRYTDDHFWCKDLATGKISLYRRDRVLEIRI
ncbi:hypothetical protein IJG78_00140 [Candidatus Saccharibacteria bacterium]|nr:hypothetical protein [Candidatus Saccharibacteria bacterium]